MTSPQPVQVLDNAAAVAEVPTPAVGWTIAASSFAFIIVQLDITIVNVALPQIGADLNARVSALQWVVDAYTLGFAVFLLSAGALSDKFGSKRLFLAGFLLFALASAACGLSPNATFLNIARAIQGIGAALLVPSSLAILNGACAHDKKLLAKAIGLWTAAGGVSIAAGPVLGGLLLAVAGWRSIFWVNIPICILGFILTMRVVPAMAAKQHTHSFDFLGQILAIFALTGLVGAVIELHPSGFGHPLVLSGFCLALVAGVAFIMVEKKVVHPMLPLNFFHQTSFTAAVLFGVFVNFSYYGVIFVISFYLQKVQGYNPMQAGLAFLPLTGTFILSNLVSGWLIGRAGIRLPMVLGGFIGALGYGLLGSVGIATDASFLQMLPGFVLIPAGMGLAVPAMTTSILSSVEKARAGTASAVLNTARQVGGAFGVAVFGALVSDSFGGDAIVGVKIAMLTATILLLIAAGMGYLVRPVSGK
ncbi:MFS transporter, DHA2 family, methylenomycin A resistance protein [Collimonas sp. OK607]|uniref:MFS transporter n=1 Tax=Collimonas sp. OK607 TaxID=1798194 RepID=UPI0008EB38A7|nr:MFS transporter [Collimonas sp. OK607]SFB13655.1 MFS transporter, DHA2 family, methylenomycin A resistance protein [Collimonas sp. OK607]